ncbi:uncharacterized protein EDB91DRAFT_1248497 [Suillus paluster]|uniref:uncharacterized protein n=1 Tax=Suillus paluster TaxID=48578 RepID=UPI001B86B258|nr:uncharacterized protein EDB91DRAFT_1248497 [Suillus paluster]KAG1740178.1 hypothetical protein EDB91DRAFT_1248497 [Suillus paluster]
MSVSPQVAVHLAIALTVLKHKSKDQSIPSCLLDLKSHFPLTDDSQGTCDEDGWRDHALALERELEFLKDKREEDQDGISSNVIPAGKPYWNDVELLRLRQSVSKDVPDDSDAAPPKKKAKKTGKVPEYQDDDWSAKRKERLNVEESSPSLTTAFTSLRTAISSVSSQTGDGPTRNSHLLAAITRTIDIISKFLGLHNISTPSSLSELNESRIAMASPLMVYVIRVAFPGLLYQGVITANNAVVSRLIDSLFVPLVRSFALTSQTHIMRHLHTISAKKTSKSRNKANEKVPKTASQSLFPDTRMDLLTLLGEALNALDSISPRYSGYTSGIRERIALESIRALESLYSTHTRVGVDGTMDNNADQEEGSRDPESSQTSHPHRQRTAISRKDRLEAVARKDATWYLCHILNSCSSKGGAKDGLGSILSGALLDGATRLVKVCVLMDCDGIARVGGKCVMDMICRNMVLAACEKIIGAAPQENPGGL